MPAAPPPFTVVTLGDSITFGAHMQPGQTYPEQLQALLDQRYGAGACRVVNAGIGGQTTVNGLSRLDRDVLAHKPDVVILSFGVNDCVKTSATAYQVGPEAFEASLRELVARVRSAGAEPILATSLPALAEYYFDRHPREFYELDGGLEALLQRYRGIERQVALETKTTVADWYAAFRGRETALLRTPDNSGARDGVHPSPEGYRVIALECFVKVAWLMGER